MRRSPTPLLRPLMLAVALASAAVVGRGSAGDLHGFAPPATGLLVVLALGVAWRRAERRAAAGQRARDAMVGTAREATALLRLTSRLQRCQDVGQNRVYG